MINNESIVEEVVGHFVQKVSGFEEPYGLLTFTTEVNSLVEVVEFLKNHATFKFNFLTDQAGVHFPDNKGGELCSVCMLHSWENNIRVRIKTFVPIEKPNVPTLSGLYACANWMERENFDFYGINYLGHPNLKRILNIDEMDYFPMRKEYPLEDATRDDKIDALFGR